MNRIGVWIAIGLLISPATHAAADDAASRSLADRSQRGTLQDAAQVVRGDSGRWNDEEHWLHSSAPDAKASGYWLDDWLATWSEKEFTATAGDENWLLFGTRQLNDHDRVWIERIEREGNRITVVVHHATWQGRYFKNFTYYQVFGVNLGRLEPGDYAATCIVRTSTFDQFEGDGRPLNNWPKDEQLADQEPLELSETFTVVRGSH